MVHQPLQKVDVSSTARLVAGKSLPKKMAARICLRIEDVNVSSETKVLWEKLTKKMAVKDMFENRIEDLNVYSSGDQP